jgi:hypothetical protein
MLRIEAIEMIVMRVMYNPRDIEIPKIDPKRKWHDEGEVAVWACLTSVETEPHPPMEEA